MCNRNRCGCGYGNNSNWNEWDYLNDGFAECSADAYWREAERILRERNRRRHQEDRCAREFVRCIRCINNRNY